jgi:two-component system, sensor histidine kinase and response regulator
LGSAFWLTLGLAAARERRVSRAPTRIGSRDQRDKPTRGGATRPYDVVLMDCHMPELDGFAATAAIRRAEAQGDYGRRTPIVALTADALVGDAEKCRAAGMDDHLAKPLTRERLATVVERWVPADAASG